MALTAEQYQQLQQDMQQADFPNELRAGAEKAIRDYGNQQSAAKMDPSMPLLPQALAMQPATTHPEGDDAAQKSWISDPQKSALNALYVYEPPLEHVKQELASNPQMVSALHEGVPVQPDEIANLSTDSGLYQAYADLKWREAAAMAAEQGKTAYRYSKAPWLQGGQGMGLLKTLGMKLAGSAVPLSSAQNSFVMGVDKATTGGAARRLQEHFEPGERDVNAQDEADHPVAEVLGGVTGALTGWGPANAAIKVATGAAAPIAGAIAADAPGILAGAGRLALAVTAGAVGGAAGGALSQGLSEGVNAAADATEGKPLSVPEGAGARLGVSALGGGALGGVLGSLGGLAGEARGFIDSSQRYRDIPEFQRAGGTFDSRGPVPGPGLNSTISDAKAAGVSPVSLQAKKVAPMIEESTGSMESLNRQQIAAEKRAFYETTEGKQRMPATNTANKTLDLLRKHSAPADGGGLAPIVDDAPSGYLKTVFNRETEAPSFEPHPGAIRLEPEEASVFLSDARKNALRDAARPAAGSNIKAVKALAEQGASRAAALGPAELDAVRSYTSGDGSAVGTGPWRSAISKLRVDTPTDAGSLYHGTRMPDSSIDRILSTGSFRVDKPTSLSFNRDLADAMSESRPARGGKVVFEVQHLDEGTNLMAKQVGIGRSGLEREILVTKPTDFEVTGHNVDSEGTTHIQLKQAGSSARTPEISRPVYIRPRDYNAFEQETAIERFKKLPSNTADPFEREKEQLYASALSDRDQRPMNGTPGGWSMKRAEHEASTSRAKAEVARATPTDPATRKPSAFEPLRDYAHDRENLPRIEALRDSAVRAGGAEQLEKLRQLGVLESLQAMAGLGHSSGRSPSAPGALLDLGVTRGYHALDRLAGPLNPRNIALSNALLQSGEQQLEREDTKQ